MKTPQRKWCVLVMGLVGGTAALVATACTSTTPGTVVTPPTTASTTPTDVFAGVRSCDLLRAAVANQGFEPVEQFNVSSNDGCGTSKLEFAAVRIDLDDRQGLQEFRTNNSSARTSTVNGRQALEDAEPHAHRCTLAVEVTQHARMLAITQFLPSTNGDPCEFNTQVATTAEPQLPNAD